MEFLAKQSIKAKNIIKSPVVKILIEYFKTYSPRCYSCNALYYKY